MQQLAYTLILCTPQILYGGRRAFMGQRELASQRAHSRLFADSFRTNQERAQDGNCANRRAGLFAVSLATEINARLALRSRFRYAHYPIFPLSFFFLLSIFSLTRHYLICSLRDDVTPALMNYLCETFDYIRAVVAARFQS